MKGNYYQIPVQPTVSFLEIMFFYICVTGLLYRVIISSTQWLHIDLKSFTHMACISHGSCDVHLADVYLAVLIVSKWNLSCLFELSAEHMPYGWEKTLSFASILDAQQFSWHSILTPSFLNPLRVYYNLDSDLLIGSLCSLMEWNQDLRDYS